MPSYGGNHTRRSVTDIGDAGHGRKKFPAAVWICVAFAPWIVYWVLSGAGLWKAAVTSGLVASLILNGYGVRRRRARVMEVVTLGFFAVHFTATVLLGSRFFCLYDAVLVSGTLAAMAWGTLLAGSPFTYQYAREDWPPVYWKDPLFRRTNGIITAVWGLVFSINTLLGVAGLLRPEARLWLAVVLPNLGLAAAVVFSVLFPRWYPRRVMEREILAREPYRWPAPAFGPQRPAGEAEHDVIVVGAGIGGLTAGALLARRGLKVLVLDQQRRAGGYCTSWERTVSANGRKLRYTFDAGVHDISGLGPRGPVRSLLRQLGIEGRLNWHRMGHEYVLPGLRLKVPHRVDEFVALLGRHFPAERENLTAFFLEMEAVYRELYADVERTGGVPCPLRTPEEMLAYPRRCPRAFRWMDVPFVAMLDAYFSDPRLKQILTMLTAYLRDDPGTLTVGEMAPVYGYYFDGGYYPAGGAGSFAEALADVVRECGSRVRLGTLVHRILVEKGRATGVELAGGAVHRARAVISNADVRRTFLELVGREHLPADFVRRIEALRPSTSAFAVFLGVDFVPDTEPITMFLSDDGEGLGLFVPSRVDPTLAPPGHSCVTLLRFVPQPEAATWDREAPAYAERKRRYGDELLALAERVLPGLRDHIVFREEASPATFARYARTTDGAIYGLAAGRWRPPSKAPIEGLYLAGAGVFPGAGVEAVVISGTLAADAVYPG